MSFAFSEDLLQFIWQFQLYNSLDLKTDTGQSVTIKKQGYLNKSSGPDFSNAEITIDGTSFFGAIEIHIKSGDWHLHDHHTDNAYNQVILHVCYEKNKEVYREDGTVIPTIELKDRIHTESLATYQQLMENQGFIPCEKLIGTISKFEWISWKDRMIIERLESRCNLYSAYLDAHSHNWNQAFFISLTRAFGMPTNSECFEEIAMKLPYDIVIKHQQSLFQLEALFFGTAGLLDEELNDNYYIGLQKEYTFLKVKYKLKAITSQLKFGRIRPMNAPHVRIAQLAALFHHQPRFIHSVLELPEIKSIRNQLDFSLSSYWDAHYSFGESSKPKQKKIASGFINHLFLNAIVPFVFFYQKNKMEADGEKAVEYLSVIPSEQNTIIKQWKTLGVESKSAADSQALLHLYKTYCKPKSCLDCNIGKRILVK